MTDGFRVVTPEEALHHDLINLKKNVEDFHKQTTARMEVLDANMARNARRLENIERVLVAEYAPSQPDKTLEPRKTFNFSEALELMNSGAWMTPEDASDTWISIIHGSFKYREGDHGILRNWFLTYDEIKSEAWVEKEDGQIG